MVHARWNTVGQFLKVLVIELPYGPASPLLSTNSRARKIYIHTNTYTQMFTAALLMIAKNCKQPQCPSVDEYEQMQWGISP